MTQCCVVANTQCTIAILLCVQGRNSYVLTLSSLVDLLRGLLIEFQPSCHAFQGYSKVETIMYLFKVVCVGAQYI